ncbi:MAG TPA: DUF5818 domain-containing protein [Terriglobia bacterium]|nr:DUF5818 domain-containing protein [Terriglobia bacterium]
MRKSLGWILGLAALVVALQFSPRLVAVANAAPSQNQAQQPQQPQQQPGDQAQQQQTFTGKIAKAQGKYVLQNPDTKTAYTLDDQDKAKQFEGQSVKVTGTLDAQNNMIHVSDIQPG